MGRMWQQRKSWWGNRPRTVVVGGGGVLQRQRQVEGVALVRVLASDASARAVGPHAAASYAYLS